MTTPKRMPSWLVALLAFGIGAGLVAGYIWWSRQPTWLAPMGDGNAAAPAPVVGNSFNAMPAGGTHSVAEEVACVDRVMAGTVPPGTDIRAALDACRYQPSDEEIRNAAAAGIDLTLPPPPARPPTPGELPPPPALPR